MNGELFGGVATTAAVSSARNPFPHQLGNILGLSTRCAQAPISSMGQLHIELLRTPHRWPTPLELLGKLF